MSGLDLEQNDMDNKSQNHIINTCGIIMNEEYEPTLLRVRTLGKISELLVVELRAFLLQLVFHVFGNELLT